MTHLCYSSNNTNEIVLLLYYFFKKQHTIKIRFYCNSLPIRQLNRASIMYKRIAKNAQGRGRSEKNV